ncbi:MAG: ABC transporter permease [Acidimicrobiales bacterium]|nr:ABC transporter permease [Acidimicrobiales bacterium]
MRASVVGLIARRELLTRVRSRSFRLGTAVIAAIAVLIVVAPQVLPGPAATEWTIGVGVDAPAGTVAALGQLDEVDPASITVTELDPAAGDPARLVADGDIDAVVVAPDRVVVAAGADDRLAALATTAVVQARLAAAGGGSSGGAAGIEVVQVGEAGRDDADEVVGFAGVLALFMAIGTYGGWVLMSVIEEKSNRVVEIVVSTVDPGELLGGKVLGNGAAGLAQFATVIVAAVAAAGATGSLPELPGGLSVGLVAVVGWFVLGFALYASAYAAAGSLVSRQSDAQSAQAPMLALVMLAYLIGAFVVNPDPSSTTSTVLSMVPPIAPLTMPVRIAAGAAQPWEVAVAVVLTLASTWLVVRASARIYTNAILQTGARVPLREALRAPAVPR